MAAKRPIMGFAAAFGDFHSELHAGQRPYIWQVRMATDLANGLLCDALEAPTGAGKTTLIECFLFAHAWQQAGGERTLPRRLFWVIDRRGVVDQVFEGVERITASIDGARSGALGWVKEQLQPRAEIPPVQVARWRGGIERWRQHLSPEAPAVICSTVDQVGSRLLFRGYGRSHRSRPVDAALVGTDSLIVLDEAHLSKPFAETIRAVARYQRSLGSHAGSPAQTMEVSATLPDDAPRTGFSLTEDELAEEPIARRVNASKPTVLVPARNRVEGVVREARKLAGGGARLVGVVLNTVNEAREVYAKLSKGGEALLVIGPSRTLDRAGLLNRIPQPAEREKRTTPMFVVATQTIEVGLDLDFDGLVSACAPFSSLVQRFGRLDRSGALAATDGGDRFGTGWVAAIVFGREPCPVYGENVLEVWEWLSERATNSIVDLSPRQIDTLRGAYPPPAPAGPLAPILAPWHLEALAQTSDDPVPSPDVGSFLHGERALEPADLRVAWRAELHRGAPDWRGDWIERVRLRPPHQDELMALSPATFRRWLSGLPPTTFGDVESVPVEKVGEDAPPVRPVVRVPPPGPDGPTEPELLATWEEVRRVAPGDLLVVSAQDGGCDEFGWAPSSRRAVQDLSNYGPRSAKRAAPRVLVQSAVGASEELDARARTVAVAIQSEATSGAGAYGEMLPAVREWLQHRAREERRSGRQARAEALDDVVAAMGERGKAIPVGGEDPAGLVLEPVRIRDGSTPGAAQPYQCHVTRVEELAVSFATGAGLVPALVESIRFAARHHDLGKLDRRFQAWLNGGEVADPQRQLAKSGQLANPQQRERERIAAGWPRGKRHEAISASLVAAARDVIPVEADADLVLHLISVHHGQHRPFQPSLPEGDGEPADVTAEVEGKPVTVRSDAELPWSEQVERFVALLRQYGPWGLAALESMLVLADHAASAEADS